jgi:chromate transport protein ChrA
MADSLSRIIYKGQPPFRTKTSIQTMEVPKVSPETQIELQTRPTSTSSPTVTVTADTAIEREAARSPPTDSTPIDEFNDNAQVPKHSPLQLFWFFLWRFGLFAWGGPVAQIALIKEQLVLKHKWITIARFNRVFAVYQILPGPEAAELCMFFGCLSGGRLGGIAAGIGFILPGFLLMLLASYLYVLIGFQNPYVNASFRSLQPLVAAMVCDFLLFANGRFYGLPIKLLNILLSPTKLKRSALYCAYQLY